MEGVEALLISESGNYLYQQADSQAEFWLKLHVMEGYSARDKNSSKAILLYVDDIGFAGDPAAVDAVDSQSHDRFKLRDLSPRTQPL
ncbi:hypothetical protein DIZ76_016685 [Coccidioides immitis]|nr:hypothetical protein DIZ76_016685 [Coccidioides immitis]